MCRLFFFFGVFCFSSVCGFGDNKIFEFRGNRFGFVKLFH